MHTCAFKQKQKVECKQHGYTFALLTILNHHLQNYFFLFRLPLDTADFVLGSTDFLSEPFLLPKSEHGLLFFSFGGESSCSEVSVAVAEGVILRNLDGKYVWLVFGLLGDGSTEIVLSGFVFIIISLSVLYVDKPSLP